MWLQDAGFIGQQRVPREGVWWKGIGTSPEEQRLWEADTSPRYFRGLRVRLKHGF